ncbi:hypothetical protein MSG28_009740 [Choristoneura fumiferana]|uniref:Uncharacterized protein n=1 Tax=Choristoneura fumiferana TaxID=7141 RepID=A0ACC0JCC5_CHOFU|nr:hypothetical protein MSG28_009740 [Choristoneura fumiferana]
MDIGRNIAGYQHRFQLQKIKNRRAAHFVFVQTKDELFRELETFQLASYKKGNGLPPCSTPETITLMRVLILLCFMVLLCSCVGVLINVTSLNSKVIKMLRRNAVPSIMCVFWVIAIVGVCYYTTVVLGMANNNDPNTIQVDYEYGFYTITGAGALALLASAANLWGAPLSNEEDIQRRNLMEDWDGYEAHSVGPTPAVPTLPPYTPSADYVPSANPTYAPPILGAQQYFPK